jgi:hypothetical protein
VRRRRAKIAFALWSVSLAGCGKSASPECSAWASVQALCQRSPCDLTWQAVQTNQGYCGTCTANVWSVWSCGDYDVLTYQDPFASLDTESRYYDKVSGNLVADMYPTASGSEICGSAPGVTFVDPHCSTGSSAQLPGWCPTADVDAGASSFPCCERTLDQCSGAIVCPTTWRDSKAAVLQYCALDGNPQAGVCGDYDVLRYVDSAIERSFYYDATGALVAVITSGSLCEYGPANGVELPICSSLPSICPDGGVDGG